MTPVDPGRESLVPKPKNGVDVRKLPITPMEAFVLSRVDGRANGSEIALATGMPAANVVAILDKLDGLGAVQYGDGKKTVLEAKPVPVPTPAPWATPVRLTYDPSELDEPADLDPERKHRILDMFARLTTASHYELLGASRDADKKAIKNAYYDVVGLFHPDKYFGKSLGAFKPKLEKIFQRVTEAHDTLTRAASRAEYDSYLASQEATRAFEEPAPGSVAEIQREIEREASREPAFDAGARPAPPTLVARQLDTGAEHGARTQLGAWAEHAAGLERPAPEPVGRGSEARAGAQAARELAARERSDPTGKPGAGLAELEGSRRRRPAAAIRGTGRASP